MYKRLQTSLRARMKDDSLKMATLLLLYVLFLCFSLSEGGEHIHCNRTYEKIGCFKRNQFRGAKLFTKLVMTDRDWGAPQYGGQDIDWFKWADYIHGFACRCLDRLKQKASRNNMKYHHFTVSNYGECWTSEDVVYDLTKIGLAEDCVGDDFLSCHDETETECVGAEGSQYVYHVHYEDEPLEKEFELLNSQCRVETVTVCTSPSSTWQGRHVSSAVHL